ncbi:MAG: hypothetical protein ACI85I_000271 [Arenicella sp.]|jgi:hypothetical protein
MKTMKITTLFIALYLANLFAIVAQTDKIIIQGIISDASSGESLPGRISKCRTLKKHTLAEVGFIRNLAFIMLHYFI